LPVSRLINVSVNLEPTPAPFANFDTCLIVGDSNVINVSERIKSYNTLAEVAADFGTSADEYLAATLFFGQSPQPSQLFIGRWAQSATHGMNIGGPLTAQQQVITNWNGISTGSFHILVDGTDYEITGLDFTSQTNLNGVATVIQTALTGATCVWNGTQFTITSNTTGTGSTISYLTTALSGVDISSQLMMTASTAESIVNGIAAESALDAVIILDSLETYWYFMGFAVPSIRIDDSDYLAIAAYIEGASNPHMFGITTNEAAAVTTPDTSSIGYFTKLAGYRRTAVQYSTTNPFAIFSMFAYACTVDFTGSNTAITLMWKQEPGVDPEFLGSSQADQLNFNNYNYNAEFNNGIAIIVNGITSSGFYIDVVWGCDWFANNIQVNLFNLLLDTPKIPQTDAGVHLLVTTTESSCIQGVTNGLLAPGLWTGPPFGALKTNQQLTKGWYVYAPPVATQPPAIRVTRVSPLIQVAAKLAGAVQTVDVLVNVNQ
jgi:hypothetical protein